MTNEHEEGQPGAACYRHLKREASEATRQPGAISGTLYLALCGHWVYDSIASDADCPDRTVTCPRCIDLDPHPEFRSKP